MDVYFYDGETLIKNFQDYWGAVPETNEVVVWGDEGQFKGRYFVKWREWHQRGFKLSVRIFMHRLGEGDR